ncbi:hypothetical protein AVEN_209934-1 [Araneus ventricosus]|uniref:Uncharacterized protein n=1 Tax=Araneus ventricosus TaxID=182803 RepID=A0A4Y2DDC8_ARAVE|nr:hypothetical protein AVEN_209934-1 [Araneus ventricosus]
MDHVFLNCGQMMRSTPELAPPSPPNFRATPADGHMTPADLKCTRQCTAVLRWNRVSNLEPSGPKAETLPIGTVALKGWMVKYPQKITSKQNFLALSEAILHHSQGLD